MTTITVPRETWDALREALNNWLELDSSDIDRKLLIRDTKEALTAVNAVSEQPLKVTDFGRYALEPQATEPAEKEDPLQGAVDWLLQADGEFFAVATVQRTLRIGYNRAKRLADIARERAAAPEVKQ